MHLRRAALLASLVATGVLLGSPSAWAADVCDGFRSAGSAGNVGDPALTEISGLVASREHPGVFWAHDDSGAEPAIAALDATGRPLGTYAVAGADAVDWEAVGIGPGPEDGRHYLYIGDIGDNRRTRDEVVVYRVPEPAKAPGGRGGRLESAVAIRLAYPEGPANAEALFVDPLSGDLHVVTKEDDGGEARVFRVGADALDESGVLPMEPVGSFDPPEPSGLVLGLPGSMVTGADISPDGSLVLVRTYRAVLAFERRDGESVADAMQRGPCEAPQVEEQQGETVAFTGDGRGYLTVSEGPRAEIHRFQAVAPLAPATRSPADAVVEEATRGGRPVRFVLTVGAALVGAAAALYLTRRRRRR